MRKFFSLLLAASLASQAATFPYQGLATDASNVPVPDKIREFSFALFSDSTGTKELWSETQLVTTHKGLFSVELGSKTPISEKVLRSGDPFLAVNLGDGEIKPRLRLGRVPRANHAIASDSASFASKVAGLDALIARVAAIESANAALSDRRIKDSSRIAQLERLLKGVTRAGQEIVFEGVNLNVRNGLGKTDSVNGLGNLTIGYNELQGDTSDHRSGSHMLVLGQRNSYTSYGGIVGGFGNLASGEASSVLTGKFNKATGEFSVVVTGFVNDATGSMSAVVSGISDTASGENSVVVSGTGNRARGRASVVVAGTDNRAGETAAVVVAGDGNTTTNARAAILTGTSNTASGRSSGIGGGSGRTVSTENGFAP